MGNLHVFAWMREKTLPVFACAVLELVLACRGAEIGSRAAHVMDVSLEIGQCSEKTTFLHDGFHTAGLNDASLMEGDGAEAARSEASAGGGNGKVHFLQGGHAAKRIIHGMPAPGVGKGVYMIQRLTRQWQRRLILNQITIRILLLAHAAATDGVLLFILCQKRPGIGFPILTDLFVRGQKNTAVICFAAHVANAADIRKFSRIHTMGKPTGAFKDGCFTHAIHQQRCTGIHQNGMAHLVIPVIVMRKAPERRFHSTNQDGHIPIGLTNAVAVYNIRPVRPHACFAAGGVGIVMAALFRHGIMINHAVDDTGGDQKPKLWTAEPFESAVILPRRKA